MESERGKLFTERSVFVNVRARQQGESDEASLEPQVSAVTPERVRALHRWLERTHIQLRQINGQRRYGAPPQVWDGPTPGAHCEVYISQIPRDIYEDVLIPLFSSIGPLWEFRLMMNFSGQNRGFAYAKYGSAGIACEAIGRLDGLMIKPGHKLRVRRSTEKRRIYITDLPTSTEHEWLTQVLNDWFNGVEEVTLKPDRATKTLYAVVKFSSHHTATMAKKVLIEAFLKHFKLSVHVQWNAPSVNHTRGPSQPFVHLQCHSAPQRFAPPPPTQLTSSVFCRVVGGPISSQSPLPFQGHQEFSASPQMLLEKLCEATVFCQPKYELYYSHTEANGLHFHFKVFVPGFLSPFKGMVAICPGPTASDTEVAARQAAAQQVLEILGKMEG